MANGDQPKLLIGGAGRDWISSGGTGSEDVLIGGDYLYAGDRAEVSALMATWMGGVLDTTARVDSMSGMAQSVVADDARDTLTGGKEFDWYLVHPEDKVNGPLDDDLVTYIEPGDLATQSPPLPLVQIVAEDVQTSGAEPIADEPVSDVEPNDILGEAIRELLGARERAHVEASLVDFPAPNQESDVVVQDAVGDTTQGMPALVASYTLSQPGHGFDTLPGWLRSTLDASSRGAEIGELAEALAEDVARRVVVSGDASVPVVDSLGVPDAGEQVTVVKPSQLGAAIQELLAAREWTNGNASVVAASAGGEQLVQGESLEPNVITGFAIKGPTPRSPSLVASYTLGDVRYDPDVTPRWLRGTLDASARGAEFGELAGLLVEGMRAFATWSEPDVVEGEVRAPDPVEQVGLGAKAVAATPSPASMTEAVVVAGHARSWSDHFEWNEARIAGKSAARRGTIELLRMNVRRRVQLREALIDRGHSFD